MIDKVLQWSNEAECFRIKSDYIKVGEEPDFKKRQDDFYISLINRLYDELSNCEFITYDKHSTILSIAMGLEIYSNVSTQDGFHNINKNLNTLYVSALYYICDFYAISTKLVQNVDVSALPNDFSKSIYIILSGGQYRDINISLQQFLENGDNAVLDSYIRQIKHKLDTESFESVDEFFDTFILNVILNKFKNNNVWTDLTMADPEVDWSIYIQHSISKHILSFLPSQKDVLNGILSKPQSFSLRMPTSAGKSYMTEVCIYHELVTNREHGRVLYLTPLRSLAFELRHNFKIMSRNLGVKYKAIYGGGWNSDAEADIKEAQLLISTPETMMSLERFDDIGDPFSLVICDEAHLIDDISRGVSYEMLITRFKHQGQCRFIFISAIIPNMEQINQWLGGDDKCVGKSKYRPSKLLLAEAIFQKQSVDLKLFDNSLNNQIDSIIGFANNLPKNCSQRLKKCACALMSLPAGSVMLFVCQKHSRLGVDAFAKDIKTLCINHGYKLPISYSCSKDEVLIYADYLDYIFGSNYPLSQYVRMGFAYHTADLLQDIREDLEQLLYNGTLPLVICTSTLAQGVNFPIKTIVLGNIIQGFRDNYPNYVSTKDLANIVGRAGRAGMHNYGLVILPEANYYIKQIVRDAIRGNVKESNYGFLSYILKKIVEVGNLTEDAVDILFNDIRLSEGIDSMLAYVCQNYEELNKLDIEELIKDTLAYFVGTEEQRAQLKRVFEVRRNKLSRLISAEQYHDYRENGISIELFRKISDIIEYAGIELFIEKNNLTVDYFSKLLDFIKSLDENIFKDLTSNISNYAIVLIDWISGATCKTMADRANLSIDEVMEFLRVLQYPLIPLMKSISKYVSILTKNDLQDFNNLIEYLTIGVNGDRKKIISYDLKTSDRLIIHFVDQIITDCKLSIMNIGDVNKYINYLTPSINKHLEQVSLPEFTKRKIRKLFNIL